MGGRWLTSKLLAFLLSSFGIRNKAVCHQTIYHSIDSASPLLPSTLSFLHTSYLCPAALRLALQSGLRPHVLLDTLLGGGGEGGQVYQRFKPIINRWDRT